ncbi:hypothetical protein HBI56_012030 [Parastagonospora nodorum]|uniref:Uncharacterized protein n=1 Tax=Phaeosphaeria nodorum (strain SN15 / ATCC MYA-4574 / FGSC 10173) TaxID=321614 RepID=A0A7U2HVZ3_PHANO|nr:hypothetical protein HBH56_009570 [Parastagonospora nodorum]QRC90676.1 hypothetical protein JI435_400510 [Parastagonospora nodorum SN15]KAH3934907.1 hypothetical protein HBH54_042860 [Parastagonospora nodorum]KAH3943696.1 hypothetical protein HBH53_171100 [Parastagonospora nodorum]KAH3986938.1 hypothetical protein HBH51_013740 [Parastagonospora nodorum]
MCKYRRTARQSESAKRKKARHHTFVRNLQAGTGIRHTPHKDRRRISVTRVLPFEATVKRAPI